MLATPSSVEVASPQGADEVQVCLLPKAKPLVTKRLVIGALLVAALFVAFLGGSRLRSVQNKSNVLSVLSAGPFSFREHVPTEGLDASVAWFWSGWNLWLGNAVGMTFAILIGAALVALVVPAGFVERILARKGAKGAAIGTALGSGLFMCANCATPVSMGYYRRGASLETALAVTVASPLFNVVGLVTIFLMFPADMGAMRLVFGAAAVLAVPPLVVRLAGRAVPRTAPAALAREEPRDGAAGEAPEGGWGVETARALRAWLATAGDFSWRFLPWMVAITWGVALFATFVLTPDVVRAFMSEGLLAIVLASAVGTLLVGSTMMEIPVVMGLVLLGMGDGPATALLVTLPATSAMVAVMLGREIGWKVPGALLAAIFVLGVGAGVLAELF